MSTTADTHLLPAVIEALSGAEALSPEAACELYVIAEAELMPTVRAFYQLKDRVKNYVESVGPQQVGEHVVELGSNRFDWLEETIAAQFPQLCSAVEATLRFHTQADCERVLSLAQEEVVSTEIVSVAPKIDKRAAAKIAAGDGQAAETMRSLRKASGTLRVRET
jgi:hypothetical protein